MLELVLAVFVIILIIVLVFLLNAFFSLRTKFNDLSFSKSSQSVKYGQLAEQWIPFSAKFPYNSQNFRFIGKPVDGVSFEDDKIVFVEFKTNKSQLNPNQKKVKDLVENKKVEWLEFRVE